MNKFYVYAYLREKPSPNGSIGSPFYIGKGNGNRHVQTHDNVPRPKNRANIIIIADNLSEVNAFQAEILLIHLWGRLDLGTGCLRNLTDGGDGAVGAVRSEEFRKRVSEFHKGRKLSPEHIEKVRLANLGKRHSEETKLKLKQAHAGQLNSPEAMAKTWEANRGKKHSSEWTAKISKANKGWVPSEETRKRMSEGAKRRAQTEEGKANLARAGIAGLASRWGEKSTETSSL